MGSIWFVSNICGYIHISGPPAVVSLVPVVIRGTSLMGGWRCSVPVSCSEAQHDRHFGGFSRE